ncbi:hypothetical protein KC363_g10 [Hortaea werneckii]|nr:hypothetical protein KC363_g10 [Hortaea werneckii]
MPRRSASCTEKATVGCVAQPDDGAASLSRPILDKARPILQVVGRVDCLLLPLSHTPHPLHRQRHNRPHLQHQVTLKSLSLQTLQSEYASLLQKLQRERVKSQAIEKKTSVADSEVNELTGRNEELLEQVKTLEGRVEELERKREQERSDAAREKEQWGRMLEMGTRLQARHADDRQKLIDEREDLRSRLAALEGSQTDKVRADGSRLSIVPSIEPPQAHGASKEFPKRHETISQKGTSAGFAEDCELLKREVRSLKDQRDLLRSALAAVRTHNNTLQATLAEVSLQNRTIAEDIDRCLGKDDAVLAQMEPSHSRPSSASGRDNRKFPILDAPSTLGNAIKSVALPEKAKQPGEASSVLRDAATIGRAVSPGPAELGFSVEPSSSSPEDLIRALGPLPTAGPPNSTKPDQLRLRTSPSKSLGTASNRNNGTTPHLHQPNNNVFTAPQTQPPGPSCEEVPPQEQAQVAKPNLGTEGYNHSNHWNQNTTSPPHNTSSTSHFPQDATTRRPSGGSLHFQTSSSTGSRSGYFATEPSLATYGTPNPTANPRSETYAPPAAFRQWPSPQQQQQQNQRSERARCSTCVFVEGLAEGLGTHISNQLPSLSFPFLSLLKNVACKAGFTRVVSMLKWNLVLTSSRLVRALEEEKGSNILTLSILTLSILTLSILALGILTHLQLVCRDGRRVLLARMDGRRQSERLHSGSEATTGNRAASFQLRNPSLSRRRRPRGRSAAAVSVRYVSFYEKSMQGVNSPRLGKLTLSRAYSFRVVRGRQRGSTTPGSPRIPDGPDTFYGMLQGLCSQRRLDKLLIALSHIAVQHGGVNDDRHSQSGFERRCQFAAWTCSSMRRTSSRGSRLLRMLPGAHPACLVKYGMLSYHARPASRNAVMIADAVVIRQRRRCRSEAETVATQSGRTEERVKVILRRRHAKTCSGFDREHVKQ